MKKDYKCHVSHINNLPDGGNTWSAEFRIIPSSIIDFDPKYTLREPILIFFGTKPTTSQLKKKADEIIDQYINDLKNSERFKKIETMPSFVVS